MKLLVVLMLVGCAFAATLPKVSPEVADQQAVDILKQSHPVESRNFLINQAVQLIVNQAINFIRNVINNGSDLFGIPPLDPLELDHFHLYVPAGLINLDLELTDVHASGFGGFVTHTATLAIRDLELTLDIRVPRLEIRSKYDLTGDFFTAIPLFGKGDAEFIVEDFRFRIFAVLGQSEDETSVIIERIESLTFEIPSFKSNLTGVIGGGSIDAIVNAIIEEVIIDYVHRFRGVISIGASLAIQTVLNPILNLLDTWRFLAPFV